MEYENSHSSSGQQDAGRQKAECCDGCEAGMCAEVCQTWIEEHDQQVAQAEREKVLTKLNDTIPVILFNNPEWDVSRSFLSALADEIESQRGEGK